MNLFDAFYVASGLVFVALGLVLLVGRRRHLPALGLSVYVLGLGLMYMTSSLWGRLGVIGDLQILFSLAAACGLAVFAISFPEPLSGRGRIDGTIAIAYGLGFILLLGWLSWRSGTSGFRQMLGVPGAGLGPLFVTAHVVAIISVAAWVLLPLRARRLGAAEGSVMRTLGHLAVAYLLVSPGGPFPSIVGAARGEVPVAHGAVAILSALLVQALWIRSTSGPHGRAARNIVLTLVGLTLVLGAIHHVAGILVVPIGRLLSALVLTYSVLSGHIEGLDVKVRWGISRSTIAAAFLTAFFVASEGAQIVFGTENPWAGLVAAGALVFAIAPLQRAAERLAERAVPRVDAVAVAGGGDGEQAYRRAVRWATRDAALTHDEERDLLVIATRLGITPECAFDIRNEIEMERRNPAHGGAAE